MSVPSPRHAIQRRHGTIRILAASGGIERADDDDGRRTMTCRELLQFLADYLAGALEARERARFEAHLADCPACVDYLRSYRDTIRMAKDACAPTDTAATVMPAELVDAILDATRRR